MDREAENNIKLQLRSKFFDTSIGLLEEKEDLGTLGNEVKPHKLVIIYLQDRIHKYYPILNCDHVSRKYTSEWLVLISEVLGDY